jgi:hypothetical protein
MVVGTKIYGFGNKNIWLCEQRHMVVGTKKYKVVGTKTYGCGINLWLWEQKPMVVGTKT